MGLTKAYNISLTKEQKNGLLTFVDFHVRLSMIRLVTNLTGNLHFSQNNTYEMSEAFGEEMLSVYFVRIVFWSAETHISSISLNCYLLPSINLRNFVK